MNKYFDWLCRLIRSDTVSRNVQQIIFEIPYQYYIDRDESRVEDALELRRDYLYSKKQIDDVTYNYISNEPINVLEVLIALSKRIDNQILGDVDGGTQIFDTMISNLEISNSCSDDYIRYKIDNWMHMNYDEYGHGSIFIVSDPRTPMNKTDMWYQAMYYLSENLV